jgi:hypothetical protein
MADPKYVVCPVTIPEADLERIRNEANFDEYAHCETIHKSLAREELTRICETYGSEIKRLWIAFDGWGDGFSVVHAELITRHGSSEIVKWNASLVQPAFLYKLPIGWCPLTESHIILELGARQLRRVYN